MDSQQEKTPTLFFIRLLKEVPIDGLVIYLLWRIEQQIVGLIASQQDLTNNIIEILRSGN